MSKLDRYCVELLHKYPEMRRVLCETDAGPSGVEIINRMLGDCGLRLVNSDGEAICGHYGTMANKCRREQKAIDRWLRVRKELPDLSIAVLRTKRIYLDDDCARSLFIQDNLQGPALSIFGFIQMLTVYEGLGHVLTNGVDGEDLVGAAPPTLILAA